MKILHYFLGFPPYRTGGLTKYAFDLAKSQVCDGHNVLAMWPGQIQSYSYQPYIKEGKRVEGIRNLELINPLPVSLDEGIREFEAFTKPCDAGIYITFLEKEKPDVIHIHTLMGMHREFIQAADKLKIRTILTSHDYFGFCPKINLYRYGECCDNDSGCRKCIQCNTNSLTLAKIRLMQSPLYRWAKDTSIIKVLRKRHRSQFFGEATLPDMPDVDIEGLAEKYRNLRAYYVSIYETIEFIHFNSTVAEEVYKRYMTPKNSAVVSITHRGIKLHNRIKVETGKKVILYLAPAKPYKGWDILKAACDQLWNDGENIELRVYSPVRNPSPYMVVREDGFTHDELEQMMNQTDVLVAPSVWYETFGFTVLEALSYGVPVIVSDHVGAKDIIGLSGLIYRYDDVYSLQEGLRKVNSFGNTEIKQWSQHIGEIYKMYSVGNLL